MKNILNCLAILILIISMSCKKNSDPIPVSTPSKNTSNNTNNTTNNPDNTVIVDSNKTPIANNHNPVLNTTQSIHITGGNGVPYTTDLTHIYNQHGGYITLLSDPDGDVVHITSITGTVNGSISNINNTNFKYTPNNKVFAGIETLTVNISDGKGGTTTGNITLQVGSNEQITTYNNLLGFFDKTYVNGDPGNFRIGTNGTITSGQEFNFYNSSASSATYKIIDNGNIELYIGSLVIDYQIEILIISGITYLKMTDSITGEIFEEFK